jgi:transcriptional regulator with XRE-family HTH domain
VATAIPARPSTGELIRAARLRKGLSARRLAALAGVSSAYVSRLEAGNLDPSLRSFARLAAALGLSPGEVWAVVLLEAAPEPVTPPLYTLPSQSDVGDEGCGSDRAS